MDNTSIIYAAIITKYGNDRCGFRVYNNINTFMRMCVNGLNDQIYMPIYGLVHEWYMTFNLTFVLEQ